MQYLHELILVGKLIRTGGTDDVASAVARVGDIIRELGALVQEERQQYRVPMGSGGGVPLDGSAAAATAAATAAAAAAAASHHQQHGGGDPGLDPATLQRLQQQQLLQQQQQAQLQQQQSQQGQQRVYSARQFDPNAPDYDPDEQELHQLAMQLVATDMGTDTGAQQAAAIMRRLYELWSEGKFRDVIQVGGVQTRSPSALLNASLRAAAMEAGRITLDSQGWKFEDNDYYEDDYDLDDADFVDEQAMAAAAAAAAAPPEVHTEDPILAAGQDLSRMQVSLDVDAILSNRYVKPDLNKKRYASR
jgi:hypothetical protein